MADYTHTFSIKYDVTGRASSLRAQRYDSAGSSSGSIVSTGFAELATSGCYSLTITLDDAFRGTLLITDTADATTQIPIEVNPEELINADVRTSSRSSHTAAQAATAVRTEIGTELGRIDLPVSSRSTLTAAQVRSEMDSSSTQLAAIILLVDTLEASMSTLLSRITSPRASNLDNIGNGAVALSTDLLSVKAKTDNLPAQPAAVGSAMTLADSAITAAKIASDAITAAKIAADAISAVKISTDAVTKIQNGTATAADLALVKATTDKLASAMELDGSVYRFTQNALEQAPVGSGGGSGAGTGTGNVRVNETYGATDDDETPLRFTFGPGEAGVDNGWIRAFLKSEYDGGLRVVKGETRTNADGSFAEDLMLDPDDWYLEYRLPDESKGTLKEITVEEE